MIPILRNIVAIIAAFVVGSLVNIALIMVGPMIIPPPAGVDMMNSESLAQNIHLFGPQHFLFPFLAHALGTLAGAALVWYLAGSHKDIIAWVVGCLFLLGGVMAAGMVPAPTWFIAADLILAYLPMAWLAIRLCRASKRPSQPSSVP